VFGLPRELFSTLLDFLTKPEFRQLITSPEFRQLITSIDYVQLASYNDKDDLVIVLGHNPTQDQEEKSRLSEQFLLIVHKMVPESIIESFDGGTSLTYFVRKSEKEEVKRVLK